MQPGTSPLQSYTCDCALYLMLITLFVLFARIEVKPETKITPKKKTTVKIRVSSARQAAPLLIIPIKSQFPLFLLCMNRMLPCIVSYRIVEPNPLHDLSFCHSSKQTSILADIGCL